MKNLFTLLFLFVAFVSHAQTVSISSSVPSNTFCAGTNVTFTASTSGITNPTYQWYKNSVAISGETNSIYSTNALSHGDQIYVSVPTTVSGSLKTSGLKFNFDAGNSSSYSGSGTALTDLSGSGTHATFQNAPTFVSSPIKTFQWNTRGSNGSNTTKASFSNVLGDDMTVGAWIKTSNIGNDLAHYRLLYILTGEQGGGANDWGFGIDRLGKLAFGAGPNDVTISSSTSVNTNEWTYVVATRAKSTGQIKLYINGAFNNSGTGNAGNSLNAQSSILIADGNDGPAYTFEGNISKIEGYNTVLSADDVLANYNANKGRFGISSNLNSNTITASLTSFSVPVTITGDACVNKTTLSTNSGFTAYAWYKDDASIFGATTNSFSPIAAGAYKVEVSNGTCSVTSAVTTINLCGVTADGSMRPAETSSVLISKEGATNNGYVIDDRGSAFAKPVPQIAAFDFVNPPNNPTVQRTWTSTINGVTATIRGNPTYTSTNGGGLQLVSGSSIDINGINTATTSFTLSMVVDPPTNTDGHYNVFYDGKSGGGRQGNAIWANFWGTNINVGINSEQGVNAGTPVAGITRYDFVYDGTSVKVYKNASIVANGTIPVSNGGWSSNLRIGEEYENVGNFFNGKIYRIKYQKTALDQSAITTQYNAEKTW